MLLNRIAGVVLLLAAISARDLMGRPMEEGSQAAALRSARDPALNKHRKWIVSEGAREPGVKGTRIDGVPFTDQRNEHELKASAESGSRVRVSVRSLPFLSSPPRTTTQLVLEGVHRNSSISSPYVIARPHYFTTLSSTTWQ